MSNHGVHHHHIRKRVHQKLEQYPHPHKGIRFLDSLVFCVSILTPIMTIPQAYQIFSEKAASGVSLSVWGFYTFVTIPWFIYGVVHKELPIIISNILFFLIDGAIVAGILMYS